MERVTIAPLSDLFAAFSTKGLQNKHFSAQSIFSLCVQNFTFSLATLFSPAE